MESDGAAGAPGGAPEIAPDAAAVQMRQFAEAQMAQFVQSGADAAVQIELEQYASQSEEHKESTVRASQSVEQKNAEAEQIGRCAALELGPRVSYSLRFKELEEEIAGNEKILFQSLESV